MDNSKCVSHSDIELNNLSKLPDDKGRNSKETEHKLVMVDETGKHSNKQKNGPARNHSKSEVKWTVGPSDEFIASHGTSGVPESKRCSSNMPSGKVNSSNGAEGRLESSTVHDNLQDDAVDGDSLRSKEENGDTLKSKGDNESKNSDDNKESTERQQSTSALLSKKLAASRLIDVALLMANVSQLRVVVGSHDRDFFFGLLLFCIALSIIMQILFTVTMILKEALDEARHTRDGNETCSVRVLDTLSTILMAFIIVANAFIVGFGLGGDKLPNS